LFAVIASRNVEQFFCLDSGNHDGFSLWLHVN